MAQRTIVELIDDIDGKPADETVTFSLNGSDYSIDLSTKNADKFRGLFQDYIAAGTKVSGKRSGRKAGKAGKAGKANGGSNAAEIRAWAQSNGIDVPARGRIPQEVRDQFDSAN